MKTKAFDNDTWIKNHFEEIVEKYGGRCPYILVAGRRIFPVKPGQSIRELETRLRKRYGQTIGMPVPQPQDFHSILFAIRLKV